MALLKKIIDLGPKRAMSWLLVRLSKKVAHVFYFPAWVAFKFRNSHVSLPDTREAYDSRTIKEERIRDVLSHFPNGTFLEIGIGEYPRSDRFELLRKHNISYVGCDFANVCTSHQRELAIKNFGMDLIRFAPNSTGTYSWPLFEMLQRDEKYDVIYLDGHHTFYIDLPGLLLADRLLKPGGYILLDDMQWTLAFLKGNLKRSISQWYFYRRMYDFSQYTEEQQQLPHIRMIADELLLKDARYIKDDQLSLPYWWALHKKREN